MKKLKWWMRIVGTFYGVIFVMATFVQLPARMTLSQAGITFDPSNFAHRFLIDTWVMFGLEIGVVSVALWFASRSPIQNKILVWAVLGFELVRGIIDDIYMLTRGYEPGLYIGWIVVHSIIIVTGYLALRQAQQAQEDESAPHPSRKMQQAGT